MKSLLILLALCLPAFSQTPGADDQVWTMPNPKDCGLITRFSPNQLPPGCLQSVNNIYFDNDWSMMRRGGYSLYNLTPINTPAIGAVKGLWPFYSTDGTKYLVAFSSGAMWSSKADGAWTAITGLGGLSASAEMQCVQAMGYLWCTDEIDAVFKTNVISTATVTLAPQGTLISTYKNRIVIAGVSGNQTQLYLSGELDGDDWALNLYPQLSTSPAIIDISGTNDGDKINCLMGQFQGQFLVGRNYDLYALYGNDNRSFGLSKVSQQIGCIEPKSIQEVNNVLFWVSKRGVEAYTGTQITPASYSIAPTINQIIAAAGNGRSQTLTSQADWQSGNLCASGPGACMSADVSISNVVPSSWSHIDSSTADFSTGDSAQISLITTGDGAMSSGQLISNSGFEAGSFSGWTKSGTIITAMQNAVSLGCQGLYADNSSWNVNSWTARDRNARTASCETCTPPTPTPLISELRVINASDSSRLYFSLITNSQAAALCVKLSFDVSTQTVPMQIVFLDKLEVAESITSGVFYSTQIPGGIIYAGYAKDTSCSGLGGVNPRKCNNIYVDIQQPIYVVSSTFTSACFDTSLSTPTWGPFSIQVTTSSLSQSTYSTMVATSCSGQFDSAATVSANEKMLSAGKEAIKYQVNFTNSASSATDIIDSISLSAETTGYYISECILVSSPTSYGLFQANGVSNGGSLSFWISTGATCSASTSTLATWTPQAVNSQISVTTATPYIAARVLFSIDSATQTPTLNDMTFNWNQGSNRPPTASAQYQDRYYLFYTTGTVGSPHNDHAAVLDFNNKWTLLDDINAYSATLYLNQLYIGDSNDAGNVYLMESGQSDNGSPFTMSFKTADLDMGNPAQNKSFSRLWMFVGSQANPAQSINLSCSYQLDGSSTSYALGSYDLAGVPEQSGYAVAKFPFPAGQPARGHWISISCSYSGTDGPARIYGMKMAYKNLSWD